MLNVFLREKYILCSVDSGFTAGTPERDGRFTGERPTTQQRTQVTNDRYRQLYSSRVSGRRSHTQIYQTVFSTVSSTESSS